MAPVEPFPRERVEYWGVIFQAFLLFLLPCLIGTIFVIKRLVRWMNVNDRYSIFWLLGLLVTLSVVCIGWSTALGYLLFDLEKPWKDPFFPFWVGGILAVILPVTVIYFSYRIAAEPKDPR